MLRCLFLALIGIFSAVSNTCAAENDFFVQPLNDALKKEITGISFPASKAPLVIGYDDLVYIHVLHYDFNHQVKEGRLICHKRIGEKVLSVFRELYKAKYPIEKIRLIDDYNGDDEASMQDNNTSCFNYRKIAGSNKLSNHSFGLALDLNPLYNPYVRQTKTKTVVSPKTAAAYADRDKDFPHKIDRNDPAYRAFVKQGFTWGGDWQSVKDYQHFEYPNYAVANASSPALPSWLAPENASDVDSKAVAEQNLYFIGSSQAPDLRLCLKSAETRAVQKLTAEITGQTSENTSVTLNGVSTAGEYWEKRTYQKELGAEKDYTGYKCDVVVKISQTDAVDALKAYRNQTPEGPLDKSNRH
ncbi:MAG: M15 family metallopeptidase [Alphaproteobacteria bacterium]|nr:M15 family metallopeptidase [Alphaproteobacteria bacterium]